MIIPANPQRRRPAPPKATQPVRGGAVAARPILPASRPAPAGATEAPAPAVRHLLVDEGSEGQRLDNYLIARLKGVPKTHLYRVIRSGEVRVNKRRAGADTRVAIGDSIRIPPLRLAEPADPTAAAAVPAREFPVVYEDEHLIAIDKPAGVAVHGGSGVSWGVIEQLRRARPDARFLELVHRLDKETSGLLLIAKRRPALLALQEQFRQRSSERPMAKVYSALVAGAWPASHKVIDQALHKYLDSAGERRVRAVDADHADGAPLDHPRARRAQPAGLQPARSLAQDRPHPPDPGSPRRRRACDRRRRQVWGLHAEPGAGARHRGGRLPLRPHVPACAAVAAGAPGQWFGA